MTVGEFIDWCSTNNVSENTDIFIETGKDIPMKSSSCTKVDNAVVIFQEWETEYIVTPEEDSKDAIIDA